MHNGAPEVSFERAVYGNSVNKGDKKGRLVKGCPF
jgi:hypothetical protein